MLFLLLITSLVSDIGETLQVGQADYKVTPMKTNAGLYYEKLRDIRTFHIEWNLVTSLEIGNFLKNRPNLEIHKTKAIKQCTMMHVPTCETAEEINHLIARLEDSQKNEDLLHGIIGTAQSNNDRRKRGAPLGFIGTISQALFGTLTQEDAAYYNKEIDKLYEDQKHISELLANQTHIVRSEFQDMHLHLRNLSVQASESAAATSIIAKELSNEQRIINNQEYQISSLKWVRSLERSVDEYQNGLNLLTNAIIFAKQGVIHPAIIPPRQLVAAAAKIQQNSEYEFPLSKEEILAEQFREISSLKTSYKNGRLILALRIPLLDREPFHLHRIFTNPTIQRYSKNGTLSAYVIPRVNYIATSQDQKYYFLPTESYLQSCKYHFEQPLCRLSLPMHNTETQQTCETSLLLHPTTALWKACDIRLMKTKNPYWKQLSTPNIWLYSIPETEELRVTCEGRGVGFEHLSGSGTLQLKAGCQAITRTTILTAQASLKSEMHEHYEPPVSLNISALAPAIQQSNIDILIKNIEEHAPENGIGYEWGLSKNAAELSKIETHAKELETHHRTMYKSNALSYASLGLGAIMAAIFITYICYRKVIRGWHTTVSHNLEHTPGNPENPPTSPDSTDEPLPQPRKPQSTPVVCLSNSIM